MAAERATRIWTTVALRAQRVGAGLSPEQACLACVEATAVSGASLVLASTVNTWEAVYCTDGRAGEVEELQATLGQGPALDALKAGTPVLADDLASPLSAHHWPIFAPEAVRLGVHAMHSLPLALGAIRVGVLDLYRDTVGALSPDQLLDALVYADTALLLVLDARSGITTPLEDGATESGRPALWHAEVHQAAGMVSVQLGVPVLDALVRLRAHAYGHELPLTTVARAVVERRLRFHPGDTDFATNHNPETIA